MPPRLGSDQEHTQTDGEYNTMDGDDAVETTPSGGRSNNKASTTGGGRAGRERGRRGGDERRGGVGSSSGKSRGGPGEDGGGKQRGKRSSSGGGGGGKEDGGTGGVTVSQFMHQQRTSQDAASKRRNDVTMRQRMMLERQRAAGIVHPNYEDDEEHGHYPDDVGYYDDESHVDGHHSSSDAIVKRDSSGDGSGGDKREPPRPRQQKVVDALPADHPSSTVMQTMRTCTLCHRTLSRSQFSERDRFTVNLSLAPGVTCRTCSMTVSAVRLKSMPGTERLLEEYARMGMRHAGYIEDGGGRRVAGYLKNDGSESSALVVHDGRSGVGAGGAGGELALWDPNGSNPPDGDPGNGNVMGMSGAGPHRQQRDVNSAFSSGGYGATDADRPNGVANCKYIDALLSMPCYLNLNAFGIFKSSADASVSLAALEAVRLYGTLGEECFVPHDCEGRPVVAQPRRRGRGQQRGNGDDDAGGRGDVGDETTRDEEEGTGGKEKINPRSIVCLILNEGPTPRTSIMASQHYGFTTIAIDPTLSDDWDGYHDDIPGFTGYSGSVSDYMESVSGEDLIEFRSQSVRHLIVIGMQHTKDALRLRGNTHINELRSRYDDVPTTLVSVSPVRKATLAPYQRQRRGIMVGSKLEKDVGYEPNCSYIDEGVFSEMRFLEVWNFHNAEDDEDDSEDDSEAHGEEEDEVKAEIRRGGRSESRGKGDRRPSVENANRRGKKGTSSRQWLEDQVAKNKKERLRKNRLRDATGNDRAIVMDESFNSLSTRDTMERQNTLDSGPIIGVDEDDDGTSGRNEEQQRHGGREEDWSPPDEEVTNQVWEKAMAKHDEQETLVNQFEDYNKGDGDQERSGTEKDMNAGLPPNWEAIHDPASGDYYYNNWETGEVTWDRPGGFEDSDDALLGQDCNDASDTKPEPDNDQFATQPLLPGGDSHAPARDAAGEDRSETEGSENYVYDDHSEASSGIGALQRWNSAHVNDQSRRASSSSLVPEGGEANGDEDAAMVWSDDEDKRKEGRGIPRSESSSSLSRKKKPWHETEEVVDSAGVNNNSFVYD